MKFIIIDKLDAIRHKTLGTNPEGTVPNLKNDDGHKNEDGDDISRWRGALCNVLQFIICSINTIHRPGDYLQFGTVMNNAATKILIHIF